MLINALNLLLAGTLVTAADTAVYTVLNHGRPAGDMIVARAADRVVVRYQHIDRNRGRWVHNSYHLDDGEQLLRFEARALSRDLVVGDVTDMTVVASDSVRQTAGQRRTSRPLEPGMVVTVGSSTPWEQARLARVLLRAPGATAPLSATSTAHARIIYEAVVATDRGTERVRLVHVRGLGSAGTAVWLDGDDELFASEVGWFITVRRGAESALPALRAIELRFREAQADELAQRTLQPLPQTLVIRNGNLFDSETGTVRPGTTVVVRGERISEVGPAAAIAVPAGAMVIDATGRTVMPGMWEMHGHVLHTGQLGPAVTQLARGITTVRDLAADIDVAVLQHDRANAHAIVAPRLILGGFIEGPGDWAGPTEVLVRTEAEARQWVARYDSLGYRQIKLYNLVHPDLVPAIADETRRRGMILSGHVPRGLSVPAAVRLGFDEINHAAFLFSTFFQDSLYVPAMRPYSGVAAIVAPHVDVDGPEMSALIGMLREHGTAIDGTFNIWMGGRALLTGREEPAALNYARLIRRLHDAGVPLLPGTDNITSSTYVTELELYEYAGIPAPAVLQLATIVSARFMGDDADYGSIVPGKIADIIIVDGNPAERIADLDRVEHVIRAGRPYSPDTLRRALAAAAAVTQ
jgi:imidazolonepropionase-like amidohydrolase